MCPDSLQLADLGRSRAYSMIPFRRSAMMMHLQYLYKDQTSRPVAGDTLDRRQERERERDTFG